MASNNSQLISQKESQKSSYQSSVNSKQRTYNNNKARIERLKKVKATLETQKGYANERYKNIKSYVESSNFSINWTGNNADKTKKNISEKIVSAYKSYVGEIDRHLDAVCDEITRIENENYRLNGDILRLRSWINDLTNEIEKLFN